METLIVVAIIVCAGVWFIRWVRGKAMGNGGCGCGCGSCTFAGDCPNAPEKTEKKADKVS